jgi:hypothetical protein
MPKPQRLQCESVEAIRLDSPFAPADFDRRGVDDNVQSPGLHQEAMDPKAAGASRGACIGIAAASLKAADPREVSCSESAKCGRYCAVARMSRSAPPRSTTFLRERGGRCIRTASHGFPAKSLESCLRGANPGRGGPHSDKVKATLPDRPPLANRCLVDKVTQQE